MRSNPRPGNNLLLLSILASFLLVLIAHSALNRFSDAGIIPCMDARAERLVFSLGVGLLAPLVFARWLPTGFVAAAIAGHLVLMLVTLWLGAYAISPLGYATGQVPNLRGFQIIRANRSSMIESAEIVSLKRGAAVGINPQLLDPTSDCAWISAAGAALDGPFSCDTVYSPPNADYDVLRLRIRSSCGLPDSTGRINVSILP